MFGTITWKNWEYNCLTSSIFQIRLTLVWWLMTSCSQQPTERASSASLRICFWCRPSCGSSWFLCRYRPSLCPKESMEKVTELQWIKSVAQILLINQAVLKGPHSQRLFKSIGMHLCWLACDSLYRIDYSIHLQLSIMIMPGLPLWNTWKKTNKPLTNSCVITKEISAVFMYNNTYIFYDPLCV